MKKIDLGETIQVIASVGVIAGIVFLGVELQQNNELLAAQARAAGDLEAVVAIPQLTEQLRGDLATAARFCDRVQTGVAR